MVPRRTLYTDEWGEFEDILKQTRYNSRDLSHALAIVNGALMARGDIPSGIWLPGPYPVIAGDNIAIGRISYKLIAATPIVSIKLHAPLGLSQSKVSDGTAWSGIGTESLPANIVGWLCDQSAGTPASSTGAMADATITVTLPAAPGGGGVNYKTTTIIGRVSTIDKANENINYFNEAAPATPIVVVGSRERMAILELSTVSSGTLHDTVPGSAAIPAGWTPLFDLTVAHNDGIVNVLRNLEMRSGADFIGNDDSDGPRGVRPLPFSGYGDIVLPFTTPVLLTFTNVYGTLAMIDVQIDFKWGIAAAAFKGALGASSPDYAGEPLRIEMVDQANRVLGRATYHRPLGTTETLHIKGQSAFFGTQQIQLNFICDLLSTANFPTLNFDGDAVLNQAWAYIF